MLRTVDGMVLNKEHEHRWEARTDLLNPLLGLPLASITWHCLDCGEMRVDSTYGF